MQRILWSVIPVFLLLFTGCGGGGGSSNSNSISAPISLSVSPNTASVGVGGTQAFAGTVISATRTGITWSVQEGATGGTIDANGTYTAPDTIGTYHVIATSQADTSKTVTVTITVHTLVSIVPNGANLSAGAVQNFSATVSGSTNTGVIWAVQEGGTGGTIDATGKYTAPNTSGTFHVTAI